MNHLQAANVESGIDTDAVAERIKNLQEAIETVIKGKSEVVRLTLVTLIAGGHLLIEDVPGVGKDHAGAGARPIASPANSSAYSSPLTCCPQT
ncbi:MAG: hypothetical protein WKF84_22190 [Pyrinomonadaceae bacterium]